MVAFQYQTLDTNGAVKTEVFSWLGVTYLAVANMRSQMCLYTLSGPTLRAFQALPVANVLDWEFFVLNGELYLASAIYENPRFETSSPLFKFVNGIFQQVANFATEGASAVRFVHTPNGDRLLIFANYNNNNRETKIDSDVYRWNGTDFVWHQGIPTVGAVDLEAFQIGGVQYLAIANYADNTLATNLSTMVPSEIWRYNTATGMFTQFQSILTSGASAWRAFTWQGQTYLAVANEKASNTDPIFSIIYRFDSSQGRFVAFQSILTNNAWDWMEFTLGSDLYLIVANHGTDTTLYSAASNIYMFNPTTQQFDYVMGLNGVGASGITTFTDATGETYAVIANYGSDSLNPAVTKIFRLVESAAGADYVVSSGSITFKPSEATLTVPFGIIDDRVPESDNEAFAVTFTDQVSGIAQSVFITILDNDITIFRQATYQLSLAENTPIGRVVNPNLTWTAPSQGGQVLFSVAFGTVVPFTINNRTSVITVAAAVDREVASSYTFTVIAETGSSPVKSDFATVVVTVTDLNDNRPIFTKSFYSAYFPEGPAPINITSVLATDPDEGLAGTVR